MKREMSAQAMKIAQDARRWAKSNNGHESMKKAVDSANKTADRMRQVQEPISVSSCDFSC